MMNYQIMLLLIRDTYADYLNLYIILFILDFINDLIFIKLK